MNRATYQVSLPLAIINAGVVYAVTQLEFYLLSLVRFSVLFSLLCFIASLFHKRANALFLLRTLILGLVGYYPIIIKSYDSAAYFSFVGMDLQTTEVAVRIYFLTALALLGNEIGLWLGTPSQSLTHGANTGNHNWMWRILFYLSAIIVLIVGYLTASLSPPLYEASYATQTSEQLLGNTQAIGIIAFFCMYVAHLKSQIPYSRFLIIVVAIYLLGWSMLMRGLRQDVITSLIGLYVCHFAAIGRLPSVNKNIVLGGCLLAVLSEVWGLLRGVWATGGIDLFQLLERAGQIVGEDGIYHVGTISSIAMTIVNTLHLLDTRQIEFSIGRSYLEFIPRTVPGFLFSDRPQDYALMFDSFGILSLGGFFEIAETYMNFGVAGAVLVTLPISYLFARIHFYAIRSQSVFSMFMLFGLMGSFLRGTWYHTFALYKTFLTAMIMCAIFMLLAKIFRIACANPNLLLGNQRLSKLQT